MDTAALLARNSSPEAGNGEVSLVASLPASSATAVRVVPTTGLQEFDNPQLAHFWTTLAPSIRAALEANLALDPYIRHIEGVYLDQGALPHAEGDPYRAHLLAEPTILWRILHHLETDIIPCRPMIAPVRAKFLTDVIPALSGIWSQQLVPLFSATADSYRAQVIGRLQRLLTTRLATIPEADMRSKDKIARGLKRTIRIFNVDFQEKEAPDEFFDPQRTINPRAAWTEVADGAGVFRMSRNPDLSGEAP